MKTIFHDKESGTKLEMKETFANSKYSETWINNIKNVIKIG